MGNPAGVKRDFVALEQRRRKAAKLLERGLSEAEVARRVGVHRQSVNRWARQLETGGAKALKRAGRAGRKPKLTESDRRKIREGLQRGPEALGYGTGLWTCWRVADLIEWECGIRYTTTQVWRILRKLGWSCRRPTGRALERNEKAIRYWKRVRWPEVKKTPSEKAGPSSSLMKAD
ncbi:MAG: IS630 family transposase [Acidobacteria bacterium]|nr:IS630 family transposase [Acidobacteriota bacterium]